MARLTIAEQIEIALKRKDYSLIWYLAYREAMNRNRKWCPINY